MNLSKSWEIVFVSHKYTLILKIGGNFSNNPIILVESKFQLKNLEID